MRKIDKRACRKFSVKGLQISPNHGLLHAPGIRYIVRTTRQSIARKRFLILCYFAVEDILQGKDEPKYVTFQAKDSFLTLESLENGTRKWRASQNRYLVRRNGNLDAVCAFYSGADERRTRQFCCPNQESGFTALYQMQESIKNKHIFEQMCQTRRKIAAAMKPIDRRALPKDILEWAHREAISAHIFYEYCHGKRFQNGYCTRCRTDVQIEKPHHNREGVCPNCKAKVTFHASGRTKRIQERETVQVIQRVGKQLVIRIAKVYATFHNNRTWAYSIKECSRYLLSYENGQYTQQEFYWQYGSELITNWHKGARPVMSRYCYYFHADNCGCLYLKGIAKELKGTPWQYCQVKEFYNHFSEPLYLPSYLRAYSLQPVIEYLVKLRLFNLASGVIYQDDENRPYHRDPLNYGGKCLQEVLGVGKEYLPLMQKADVNRHCLYLLQKMLAAGVVAEPSFLIWCQIHKIYDDQDIIRCLKYCSQHKLASYISGQAEVTQHYSNRYSHAFELYKDYIRFCEDLQYDLTDDFVVFPRNVKEAHDNASKMFDRQKVRIFNDKISAAYPALSRQFKMSKNGLMIVPPKTAEEIVAEGQALHHCVGGYVSRVADKECVILFLRQRKQPNTPFYTIELREGRVAQIRGEHNCSPNNKVKAYMKLWEREKLLPAVAKAA